MKSTAERLKSSYCVPKGAEWDAFGLIPLAGHKVMWLGGEPTLVSGEFTDRAEIPVSHFIDLLSDSIVTWRLEGDGFNTMGGIVHTLELRPVIDGETVVRKITVITDTGKVYLNDGPTNVTTYTDLITLIRLIG
jgi:hypothetical protein